MRSSVLLAFALMACSDYAYDEMAASFSTEGDLAVVRAMARHDLGCETVDVEADYDRLFIAKGCGKRAQYTCDRHHECKEDD